MIHSLLLAGLLLFCFVTVVFCIALIKKDNSIADIAYGAGFVLVALFLYFDQTITPSIRSSIVTLLITLWGLRIVSRIYFKNRGKKEDFRYAAWRAEWMQKGYLYTAVRSYLQVFLLQGMIIFIIAMPALLANTPQTNTMQWYNWAGVALWVIGFLFEAIGDYQLDRFIQKKKKGLIKDNIMKTGLWKYTRHPNYFGESLMWWGLAFICLFGMPYSILVLVSPILITHLLLNVSGIPMLEKKWKDNPEWEEYKSKTSAFIPSLPRK
jgi:steroid 5-alpha reductase family enzyme